MNKKKIFLISGGLLTLVLIIISIVLITNNNEEKIYTTNKRKENVNNFLTLMLEQSDGTYQESTSNSWPGEGYIFNSELSKCQNGGELDYDSENNKVILYSNKSDGCYVYFDLYTKPTINSINLGEVTNNSITISVSATEGTNPISNYYYTINDETPVSTTSNTYTFNGLDSGTTYTIKIYVIDIEGYQSETSSLKVETKNGPLLSDYIKSLYISQGSNGIYYHTSSLANSAADNSYRYSGANPNNYVCFGSDEVTCPNDNLYRIIGVFESNVKLIKSTSYGNYAWDNSNDNTWITSDIRNTLNNIYLNSLENKWQNIIMVHDFKVGGMPSTYAFTAKGYFDTEVGSSSNSTTETMKIGLMYVSDYGFAASNNYWTTRLYSYGGEIKNNNWMYLGSNEWTISRDSSHLTSALYISSSGPVYDYDLSYDVSNLLAVRPVFYLNSNVTYVSGTGTQSDPFRIE